MPKMDRREGHDAKLQPKAKTAPVTKLTVKPEDLRMMGQKLGESSKKESALAEENSQIKKELEEAKAELTELKRREPETSPQVEAFEERIASLESKLDAQPAPKGQPEESPPKPQVAFPFSLYRR